MSDGRPLLPPTEDSLIEILQSRAESAPDRQIFGYLEDGEHEQAALTYAQLDRRARAVAAAIQERARPGDRALLLFAPGLEFITALCGCFYAGVLAVPCYPPRSDLDVEGLKTLTGISRDCTPRLRLTGGSLAPAMQSAAHRVSPDGEVPLLDIDRIADEAADRWRPLPVSHDTLALLQYTSGSTGAPRGVCVSHGNLLINEYLIQFAFGHCTAERPGVGVCWLPLYHDMGLIGNVLQAIYVDGPCFLMSPLMLLRHPVLWLQAITKYRAHSSGGPGFAFELCVQRVSDQQKESLDLSSWEIACVGAEPVSPATLDRFAAAFAPCGFRREAFFPSYGLAEATLYVSGGTKGAGPVLHSFSAAELNAPPPPIETDCAADETRAEQQAPAPVEQSRSESSTRVAATRTLVGCGHAPAGHEIVIADPATCREAPPGSIGEIWFAGPSVAQGYWNRPQETEEVFHAYLEPAHRGPFLRTGDLGCLVEGELFITGRLKDLIIIRGRNYYPQDIEETVRSAHAAFRPNRGAAFGCPVEGEERLVVVQEIDRQTRRIDPRNLLKEIRRLVAERHQLQVYDLVFTRNDTLPRTSSGKIRRLDCRRQYLEGRLIPWEGTASA